MKRARCICRTALVLVWAATVPPAGLGGKGPAAETIPTLMPAVHQPWLLERLREGGALSALEYGTARSDHAEVAQAVARCSDGFRDPVKWSPATKAVLLFELTDTLAHSLPDTPASGPGEIIPLTYYQMAAVSFSDKLSRDRLAYRAEQEDLHRWAFDLQVALVVVSALATISIGIRSVVSKDNKYVAWFAVFAIATSAAGTGLATLNTFGDYQTAALRASRTLAQLQQLHWRVVSDILKDNLICSPDQSTPEVGTLKTNIVNSWRERYETIRDSAVESLARPGDLASKTAPEGGPGNATPAAMGPSPSGPDVPTPPVPGPPLPAAAPGVAQPPQPSPRSRRPRPRRRLTPRARPPQVPARGAGGKTPAGR